MARMVRRGDPEEFALQVWCERGSSRKFLVNEVDFHAWRLVLWAIG